MKATISITLTRLFNLLQLLNLHQNNVVPDLAYILEGNDIFLLPPEDPAQTSWSRDDQVSDAAVFRVKFHIAHKPELFAVADVDDFFFFKSKIRIGHTRNKTFLL